MGIERTPPLSEEGSDEVLREAQSAPDDSLPRMKTVIRARELAQTLIRKGFHLGEAPLHANR